MISSRDPLRTVHHDVEFLVSDLGVVSAALAEIGTAWRRARLSPSELPLGLPTRLEDQTRQLADAVRALADAGLDQSADLAISTAGLLSALKDELASAEVISRATGRADLGDSSLWSHLNAALERAGKRFPALILRFVKIMDWSLSGPAAAETPHRGQARLLIELG